LRKTGTGIKILTGPRYRQSWTQLVRVKNFGSLNEMEKTGGEPDVVGHDKKTGNTFFMIALPKA